jgi:hypothetical protein
VLLLHGLADASASWQFLVDSLPSDWELIAPDWRVMAAAWACILDYGQSPKVSVVLDKSTRTRELVEASGFFVLQLPTKTMATRTYGVGSDSAKDVPDKLAKHKIVTFSAPDTNFPLVEGCVGWLVSVWYPSRTTKKPMICLLGRLSAPGQTIEVPLMATGTLMQLRIACAQSTMWPVESSS